jgi:hypothetical protein
MSTPNTPNNTTALATNLKRCLVGAVITAGAIAVGATMTVTAPAAHAQRLSENTIKSECKEAGGTYSTEATKSGIRNSTCTYMDIDGDSWTDYYLDGEYEGTDPARIR